MNVKQVISYSSLEKLLPDGVVQIQKYSIDESKKLNNRIDRTKESKILPANQFLLICIKGECRKSMNLLTAKPIKACNYNSKHIPNVHCDEARQPLQEEILIHSFLSVTGKSNRKKYVHHFQLLKVINKSTYQYIKKPKRTLFTSLSNQPISYYDEIDLFKQKSSIPAQKKVIMFKKQSVSKTTSPPTSLPTSTKAISPLAANEKESEVPSQSEVGGVYTPNRRAFKNENLKQKVVNKRTLSKNLKVRRRIVKKVQLMANKVFKHGGMLKYKRRNNIKYSQTLDRKENLDDDRPGVITIEDLID